MGGKGENKITPLLLVGDEKSQESKPSPPAEVVGVVSVVGGAWES